MSLIRVQKSFKQEPEWVSLNIKRALEGNLQLKIESGAPGLKNLVEAVMHESVRAQFKAFFDKHKGSSITIKGVYSTISTNNLKQLLSCFFVASKLLPQTQRKDEFNEALMQFLKAQQLTKIDIVVDCCK